MISDYDRRNLGPILDGMGDWFSAQLLRLIEHADNENREKLRLGFPEHVAAFEEWNNRPYDDEDVENIIEGIYFRGVRVE